MSLDFLPVAKRSLLEQLVAQLRIIPGVGALVLGGSYARGTQTTHSDIDLAIYYAEAAPFDLAEIRRIARSVSIDSEPTVTGFYEWGAWVNGGAWINTSAGKVDFLYRNLEHVQRTVAEAQEGIHRHDYAQQPAYGFYSVIYLAETQVCIPLFDPSGWLADLKRQVAVYPAKLQGRILADTLWSAEFTLIHARKFAEQGDVYNTAGCLTRVASNLTQALFALNETYFISDKRVLEIIDRFARRPAEYSAQISKILAHPGATSEELTATTGQMTALWQAVVDMAQGYRSRY